MLEEVVYNWTISYCFKFVASGVRYRDRPLVRYDIYREKEKTSKLFNITDFG